ncbi:methyltransferase [Actinomadura viridis]|uniref:methyltransferase n=1 Tax=Actinomadura viridis TaxID=58110 RepID=UPI0036B11E8D
MTSSTKGIPHHAVERHAGGFRPPPTEVGDLFSARARQYAHDRPLQHIHILEAGCGWGRGLDMGSREHHATGVDLDVPALRARTRERSDLDAWHLGDLRTVPMPPRAYDIVHAPFLIERAPHAELVLDRFVAALKPGGLLLVRLRDRNTAFGFLDRRLPRWMRRRMWRGLGQHPSGERPEGGARPSGEARRAGAQQRAGARGAPARDGTGTAAGTAAGTKPPVKATAKAGTKAGTKAGAEPATGTATKDPVTEAAGGPRPEPAATPSAVPPPPAIYERVASRQGMRWYCVMRGLVIAEEYTSREALDALGAGASPVVALCRLVALLSRGRLTADHSEVTLVIRKPENRFARVI